MLVDKQNDPVITLLKTIAHQDEEAKMNASYEAAADDLLMAEMELARARKMRSLGCPFVPRAQLLQTTPAEHPADQLAN